MKNIDDHFSNIAGVYSKGRFGYPPAIFDRLALLCSHRELAWDCGTGSGQAIPELASRFRNVRATDISAELLARAPAFPNVAYSRTPAESSGLEEASVDLVTVAQALHWFDLQKFWPELSRVLKPRGIFAFWGYNWPFVNDSVDALLEQLRIALQPYWPARSAVLHANYREIVVPLERVEAPACEIAAAWTRENYCTHILSWSAVRYCREKGREEIYLNFETSLRQIWPDDCIRETRWPVNVHTYRRPGQALTLPSHRHV